MGLPDVTGGSRVSLLVNAGQRGDMGRLHAASEAYAKRSMLEKVQAITDRLVHVGKAVIQDQAEAAAEDQAPVPVKGEREVRGKVICGEEKVMIVFHERLGLAALSAQIKAELNIQVAFVLRCRKQDGSTAAMDTERLLASAVSDALSAGRPIVLQAFTALDKEREEADLARRLAEKEKAEMEEAAREADRELREAEEAEAEAARLAEEAKLAAAASRKEEEEAEEAEAEAEALKVKKEAIEAEVQQLKQAVVAAKSRGPPAVKTAAAALASAEAKLVAASAEYRKAEERAAKERDEAEEAKKEAEIQAESAETAAREAARERQEYEDAKLVADKEAAEYHAAQAEADREEREYLEAFAMADRANVHPLEQEQQEAEHLAATSIAALYQGFRVRKGGAALRHRLALEREDAAVRMVATNVKMHLARHIVARTRVTVKAEREAGAAGRVQRVVRGHKGRLIFHHRFLYAKDERRERAVFRVQLALRCHGARLELKMRALSDIMAGIFLNRYILQGIEIPGLNLTGVYEVADDLRGGVRAREERNAATRKVYEETLVAAAGGGLEARDMKLPATHANHRVLIRLAKDKHQYRRERAVFAVLSVEHRQPRAQGAAWKAAAARAAERGFAGEVTGERGVSATLREEAQVWEAITPLLAHHPDVRIGTGDKLVHCLVVAMPERTLEAHLSALWKPPRRASTQASGRSRLNTSNTVVRKRPSKPKLADLVRNLAAPVIACMHFLHDKHLILFAVEPRSWGWVRGRWLLTDLSLAHKEGELIDPRVITDIPVPEILRAQDNGTLDRLAADASMDVFMLGGLLHHVFTGRPLLAPSDHAEAGPSDGEGEEAPQVAAPVRAAVGVTLAEVASADALPLHLESVRDPLALYIVTNCLLKTPGARLTVKDVALNLQQIPGCPRLEL